MLKLLTCKLKIDLVQSHLCTEALMQPQVLVQFPKGWVNPNPLRIMNIKRSNHNTQVLEIWINNTPKYIILKMSETRHSLKIPYCWFAFLLYQSRIQEHNELHGLPNVMINKKARCFIVGEQISFFSRRKLCII